MPTRWSRHDIAAAVKKRGITLHKLSIRAGLGPSACANALARRHRAGELVIARYIGIPVHELWPDRWRPDGTRIDRRYRDHAGPDLARCKVKNEKAA